MKIRLPLIGLTVALAFSSVHASTHNFVISPSLYVFDYAEYDSSGQFLDGETGLLPGIHFAYQFEHEQFSIQAQYSQYAADIDYDGQTQTGIPHQTQTDTLLRFYNLTLYTAEMNQGPRVFLRYGSSYWDRNILAKASVIGLHEIYRWNEVATGFRFEQASSPVNIWTEFSVLKIRHISMDVLLPSETVSLKPGNHLGFRLEAGRYFPLSPRIQAGFSGFVEHWRFAASEPQYSIDFSQFIHEPYSKSLHWGLRFNIRYRY